jgi:hypothetical protein
MQQLREVTSWVHLSIYYISYHRRNVDLYWRGGAGIAHLMMLSASTILGKQAGLCCCSVDYRLWPCNHIAIAGPGAARRDTRIPQMPASEKYRDDARIAYA